MRRSTIWSLATVAGLAAPAASFAMLLARPQLDASVVAFHGHFYFVSAVTALSLALSVLVWLAARQAPDPRTLLLAFGFFALSGIFLAHGLGTGDSMMQSMAHQIATPTAHGDVHTDATEYSVGPAPERASDTAPPSLSAGAMKHLTNVGKVIQVSARLSLLVAALFFALAVVNLPRRPAHWIVQHVTVLSLALAAAVLTYIAVALRAPGAFAGIPVESRLLSYGTGIVASAALIFAARRFWQAFLFARLPLQGAMAAGMVLLLEAQYIMIAGTLWHLSWWLYHVTMLIGFLLCVVALLVQQRTAGDLGAVVEGLFLRSIVGGLRRSDPRALVSLSAAVAARDGDTAAHLERVAELSYAVGHSLGLRGERLEALRWAGRLHDLGKIGVPDAILTKPGPLTEHEFDLMRKHSARGDSLARRSKLLRAAAPAIRGHHERWDGTGYPDRLAGDAIPLEARIVAVADVFDALTSARSYKAAWTHADAIAEIERQRGQMFDPICVDALVAVLKRQETLAAAS